ncbi:sarcoplasmic calcium-binding proteins II, V, VI, and VII-like [Paramacrobiotus metropolitanus]|uniref:sarcoplasmic calcium-binding proteins II, V, VI, and VII-like n=1 Tax=Paramacrobiotus metropolitanus TaxID=2943436 RepID=UPI0024456E72|nr:sarcoplasmic calcium-binding proteins II, V, VI, and VII-like [Paramacrobiotus metropolitanus]XP_055343657.1 sarcoplasmic calcium-binding proteins II, V, VI, and VII-like [Paramacrobiotus metropolitanus]
MALSDFQTKKLIYLYRTFFDTDNNGTIEKDDFDLLLSKISKLRGWSAGSSQYATLQQRLDGIWNELKKADVDGDGQISEKEWLKLWSDVIFNKSNGQWIQLYQDFIFDAQDTSGDGNVDEGEFSALFTSLGVPADQCSNAFKTVTAGGSPVITKDLFVKRFQEFISSSDVSAPGNSIFGSTNF